MIRLVKDFLRYRELIELLTAREIKIRYKQSVLGILWAFFQPTVIVFLFTAIFTKIVKMPTGNIPYPLFVLSGLMMWTFFSNALNTAIPSIVSNAELVRKIYFPRVIFPLTCIMACLFDFAVIFVLMLIFMAFFKIAITPWFFFFFALLALQLLLVVGISLLFSALNVFYRDVRNALSSLIQIWMFATPVIYPLDVIRPHLKKILLLNPMAGIIESARNVLILGAAPRWDYLAVSVVVSLLIFTVAYVVFKKLEPNFADAV